MRFTSSLISLAAAAALVAAPAIAGGNSHNTLTWDALNDTGTTKLESRYTERMGRQTVEQDFEVRVDGAAAGVTLTVQVNGRDLFDLVADQQGSCGARYHFRSPAVDKVRPAENRRIDAGDVIRVYNAAAGVDIAAVYQVNGEP